VKWVLDTNVVFSGTLSTNRPPHRVLRSSLEEEGPTAVYSDPIFDEYSAVLEEKGPQLGLGEEDIVRLLVLIETRWQRVDPEESLAVVEEDPDDDKFFEAAVEAEADYVVTGDKAVQGIGQFQGVETLSPRQAEKRLPD